MTAARELGYLHCPECGEDAIPSSGWDSRHEPTWCEDDGAACPGCGMPLVARLTGDGDGSEYMEAVDNSGPEAPER